MSSTNRAGVDIGALARVAHVSLEMARRYVEGLALPRPEKLPLIARWLEVDPAILLWDKPSVGKGAVIDQELLQSCIGAVMEAQQKADRSLPPKIIASIAAMLYVETERGRELPSTEMLTQLIRLTST